MNKLKDIAGYLFWVILSMSAGLFGSQFKPGKWYETLEKPSFIPPDIVFPIVWPILYVMMGTAAWLIWKKKGWEEANGLLQLFIFHLILNGLWSYLFFGLHVINIALIEILLLFLLLGYLTYKFWIYNKTAGGLLIPYLLWIAFASVLNGSIVWLN